MGNRMIKESIRTSKSVNSLNDFQFRLWLYLITYVDDFGRGSADPELIKGLVFPRRKGVTEKQIEDGITALANAGMVNLYEVDGEPFLYFPKWGDHQRIQTKQSKCPAPDEGTVIHRESPSSTVSHGESPLETNRSRNQVETEIEEKGSRASAFTPPTLEEVEEYCRERNSSVDPKKFYEYFAAGDWKDAKGNKVKNWKQKILTWEKFDGGKDVRSNTQAVAERYHLQYDV